MNTFRKLMAFAIVAVLSVVSASEANAQFRFGIKAGANFNKMHLSNFSNNFKADNGVGFTGGVMTEFQVPLIGLCFDASLMYSRMNGVADTNAQGETVEKAESKNYFNIPVNLKYKFSLPVVGSVVAPYLYTGPDFAFKLGGDESVFKTRTFQCAWNVGLGVELFNHLQISGSYAFGINNIVDMTGMNLNTTGDYKVRNNYWTVTAAWLF